MSAWVKPFLLFENDLDSLMRFRLIKEVTDKWSFFVVLIEAFEVADELNPILTKLIVDVEHS
jgi:hypothetical protein